MNFQRKTKRYVVVHLNITFSLFEKKPYVMFWKESSETSYYYNKITLKKTTYDNLKREIEYTAMSFNANRKTVPKIMNG